MPKLSAVDAAVARKRAEVEERVAAARAQQLAAASAAVHPVLGPLDQAEALLTLLRHDDGRTEWSFAERERDHAFYFQPALFRTSLDPISHASITFSAVMDHGRDRACVPSTRSGTGCSAPVSACMTPSLRALEAKGASYPRRWWMADKAKDAIAAELKRSNFCILDGFLGAAAMRSLRSEVSKQTHLADPLAHRTCAFDPHHPYTLPLITHPAAESRRLLYTLAASSHSPDSQARAPRLP